MAKVSEKARANVEAPSCSHLGTVMPTALPQVSLRGCVADWVDGDDAVAHIDRRAEKYVSQENYPMAQAGRAAG